MQVTTARNRKTDSRQYFDKCTTELSKTEMALAHPSLGVDGRAARVDVLNRCAVWFSTMAILEVKHVSAPSTSSCPASRIHP